MANHGTDQPKRTGYAMANATTTGGAAVIDIHGEIGFFGIDAAMFIADLRGVNSERIELHISSPGGDVFDGIAIYQALLDHPSRVEVMVDSLAGSIASVIAQAGDHIRIGGNGQFMIHDAIGSVFGNATEMRHMADLLDMASDNIASIYAERTGQGGTKKWRGRMTDGVDGTWYTAAEAVEVGLADEVVKAGKRDGVDPKAMWQRSITHSLAARTQSILDAAPPPPQQVDDPTPEPEPEVEPEPQVEPEPVDDLADLDLSGINLADTIREALADPFEGIDWDPTVITAGLEEGLRSAPAPNPTTTIETPVRPRVTPEPEPEDPMAAYDPDAIRVAMENAMRGAPPPTSPPEPDPEPDAILGDVGRQVIESMFK